MGPSPDYQADRGVLACHFDKAITIGRKQTIEFLVFSILEQKYVCELPVGGAGGVHYGHVERSLSYLPVSMHAVHDYDYSVLATTITSGPIAAIYSPILPRNIGDWVGKGSVGAE